MKILNIRGYRDGGSIELETDEGPFCVDWRMQTKTAGQLYKGEHPDRGVLATQEECDEVRQAVLNYKTPAWAMRLSLWALNRVDKPAKISKD